MILRVGEWYLWRLKKSRPSLCQAGIVNFYQSLVTRKSILNYPLKFMSNELKESDGREDCFFNLGAFLASRPKNILKTREGLSPGAQFRGCFYCGGELYFSIKPNKKRRFL